MALACSPFILFKAPLILSSGFTKMVIIGAPVVRIGQPKARCCEANKKLYALELWKQSFFAVTMTVQQPLWGENLVSLEISFELHHGIGVEFSGTSFYRTFFLLERETMCVCVCVCVCVYEGMCVCGCVCIAHTQEPFGEKKISPLLKRKLTLLILLTWERGELEGMKSFLSKALLDNHLNSKKIFTS